MRASASSTTTTPEAAALDPRVQRVLRDWQYLEVARRPVHVAWREEKRRQQAARREEQSARKALAAFANAGGEQQRVLLVRHGEALHNVRWREFCGTPDTPLTECGRGQARRLAAHPALLQCELLVVSPLSRAVETAATIFGERPPCRTCLCALHSERLDDRAACNWGSPRSALSTRFPFVREWDGYEELPEEWWPSAEQDAHDRWRTERVPAFLAWLGEQPEARVVVVGHGAFLSDARLAGRMLANCEVAVMRGR
eukprot:202348-Prymnesium_polylepis.1